MLSLAWVLAVSAAAGAQDAAPGAGAGPTPERQTFIYFLFGGGGVIGVACTVPILMMSVAAFALVIDHAITIRRPILMPPGLADELHGHITNGNFVHAEQRCKLRPNFLSGVVLAGLEEVRFGYPAVEKAMEDAAQGQAVRLFRKIEFLSVVANISTMLGLFGTVVGLVLAFKQVADTQGMARASDLAGGVYLALMTTVEGLIVAIPSVGAYALFKHRADQLVAESVRMAEHAFSGYKRERVSRRVVEHPRPHRSGAGG